MPEDYAKVAKKLRTAIKAKRKEEKRQSSVYDAERLAEHALQHEALEAIESGSDAESAVDEMAAQIKSVYDNDLDAPIVG
jgi:hypothetical protein